MADLNHEYSMIGIALRDANIAASAGLRPEYFDDPTCRRAWAAIDQCFADGVTPNWDEVATRGVSRAEAAEFVSEILFTENWEFYRRAIFHSWQRRQLAMIGRELSTIGGDPEDIVEWLQTHVEGVLSHFQDHSVVRLGQLFPEFIKTVEERYHSGGELVGIGTGIKKIDHYTMGLQPNQLVLIGGRPSDGKSAVLMNMATHVSRVEKQPVGYMHLEDGAFNLIARVFGHTAKVNTRSIESGMLGPTDFAGLTKAAGDLHESPLYLYDSESETLKNVKMVARTMKRQHKIKVLFIDYLQLIQAPGDAPHERMKNVSIGIKSLAKELDICIVGAAQLRRDMNHAEPGLEAFSDTSQLEKDATVAIMLQRDKESEQDLTRRVWFHVNKNKNGPIGSFPMLFLKDKMTFTEEETDPILAYRESIGA